MGDERGEFPEVAFVEIGRALVFDRDQDEPRGEGTPGVAGAGEPGEPVRLVTHRGVEHGMPVGDARAGGDGFERRQGRGVVAAQAEDPGAGFEGEGMLRVTMPQQGGVEKRASGAGAGEGGPVVAGGFAEENVGTGESGEDLGGWRGGSGRGRAVPVAQELEAVDGIGGGLEPANALRGERGGTFHGSGGGDVGAKPGGQGAGEEGREGVGQPVRALVRLAVRVEAKLKRRRTGRAVVEREGERDGVVFPRRVQPQARWSGDFRGGVGVENLVAGRLAGLVQGGQHHGLARDFAEDEGLRALRVGGRLRRSRGQAEVGRGQEPGGGEPADEIKQEACGRQAAEGGNHGAEAESERARGEAKGEMVQRQTAGRKPRPRPEACAEIGEPGRGPAGPGGRGAGYGLEGATALPSTER